jgi:hypothetical protein
MDNLYSNLPEDLKNNAVNTEQIGISGYAWKREFMLQVLDILEKLNFAILGGDVYVMKNDQLILTYDNWYYENKSKSFNEYAKNSIIYAKNYINMYCVDSKETYYFSITYTDFYAGFYKDIL